MKLPGINTTFEIGKTRPFIKTKRKTEGHPLIGTAFWKGREYHIASETNYSLTDNIKLTGGLSFAIKRFLDTDSTIIAFGGFLLLWCDKESEQGIYHVELKLSGGREQIGLYAADITLIDTLSYGDQRQLLD